MSPNAIAARIQAENAEYFPTDNDIEVQPSFGDQPEWKQTWNEYISRLLSWNQASLQQEPDDEECARPTGLVIRLALDEAERLRDAGLPPPTGLIQDANGGVILERKDGTETERLHIWDDGEIDYRYYEHGRVVHRHAI
ncbi:MAG: hypothetical protein K8S94_16655 [Planctomycetia bacterium]|nr:hypothetical protein [Planctomycetia bacterium]